MKNSYKYLLAGLTAISILLLTVIQFQNESIASDNASSSVKQNNSNSFNMDSLKSGENEMGDKVIKTEEEWKSLLTEEEFNVLRKKGTERAFTGKYNDFKEDGVYKCAGCGNSLFNSDAKYDSGSGWPSYWAPLGNDNVEVKTDKSLGMIRNEVLCGKCGSHLGHVFDDGPSPTNMRYCINSVALDFEKNSEKPKKSK